MNARFNSTAAELRDEAANDFATAQIEAIPEAAMDALLLLLKKLPPPPVNYPWTWVLHDLIAHAERQRLESLADKDVNNGY